MMTKKCSGRRALYCLASLIFSALADNTAYAWQQEYIADAMSGHTAERYTWDSDHQPSYDAILAERIRSAQNELGPVLSMGDRSPLDSTSGMSVGWNFPVSGRVTTGPVAALHYDATTTSMFNVSGESLSQGTNDPLWHASVTTLGWRLNSQFGYFRPWAQISYNQQYGDNLWKAQSGLSRMTAADQNGNWLDVTMGADMLLNPNIAAYAALSQAENSASNSDYLYTMGVSARF
ncbi:TPA: autotransporter domain-containing protein [Citrobacter freundii]